MLFDVVAAAGIIIFYIFLFRLSKS